MSFAGSWSTAPVTAPAPSSGGGGWTTGTVLNTGGGTGGTWGGGGSTGSSGGGGWLAPAPAIAPTTYTAPASAPSYPTGYDYATGTTSYSLPGAGLQVGPFGEGGPYTPLDFPLLHELRPGEKLDDLQGGIINRSTLPYLALGLIAFLILRKK